jgi:hypothetical protein
LDQSCINNVSVWLFRIPWNGVKTHAGSEGKLQIIGHVRVIGDGVVDTLVQQLFVTVEVFGNA